MPEEINEQGAEPQQNQQQNNNKDHNNFMTVVAQIFGLIGEDPVRGIKAPIFQNKVANDQVAGVMERLIGKRQEKALETFEKEISTLMDDYVTFQQESNKRRKAFEDAEIAKEKEFTKKAHSVLGHVQDMGGWFKAYQKGMEVLAKAPAPGFAQE